MQNHPYSPINQARGEEEVRRRQNVKSFVCCICFALFLFCLAWSILERLHTMCFVERSHQCIVKPSNKICMGYPNDSRLFTKPREQDMMTLKEYTMTPVQMFIDEIIPLQHDSFHSSNIHRFVHRYFISSSKMNCTIELMFLDKILKFNSISQWRQQFAIRRCCKSIRTLWTSPNHSAMREQLNIFTIPSDRLKHAAVCYFQAIHNFGRVLYLEPLSTYDAVMSNYNVKDTNNEEYIIGYSSVDSRVYEGINTVTKEPCLARIDLSHAYLFGKQHQILGILAMSDLKQMKESLQKCNSAGTVDFVSAAIFDFTTSARQLFDLSSVFVENCAKS